MIVGAGMSGLSAGQRLKSAGWEVTIVDKGRVVGGRVATRRFDDGRFDYGAQFFTLRDEAFAEMSQVWVQSGVAVPWTEHRFRVPGGMRTLPELLAPGMNIRTGAKVLHVEKTHAGWSIALEGGDKLTAEQLLLTPPVPQSMALLAQSGVSLPEADAALLGQARYWKCITLLVRIEGTLRLGPAGFIDSPNEVLSFAADNHSKGVSPEPGCMTIHGTREFSESCWDEVPATAVRRMLEAAAPLFDGRVRGYYLHRWRYAEPAMQMPELFHPFGSLAFAGDIFGGPRVGGAVSSGLAAAEYILRST